MKRDLLSRLHNLSAKVTPYWNLPIFGQPPLNTLVIPAGAAIGGVVSSPGQFAMNGAIPDYGSFMQLIQALFTAQNVSTPPNFQTSASATITLTSLQNAYIKLTAGAAVTVTLDYAWNVVNQLQFPYLGMGFPFQIMGTASTTVATPTLSDTAITLAGTTTVTTGGFRVYNAQITQLYTVVGAPVTAGTTFVSLAQVGTTNAYTLTLATNTLSPTVGNVIYLNVTAGTLPPGWYPIVKVTSATSFVIVAPPAGTAWTATAATIPGTTLVPASQYTQGSPLVTAGVTGSFGVYSPLITITGMWGMAAGVMVT